MSNKEPEAVLEERNASQVQDEVERGIFGDKSVRLRNIGGLFAVIVVCLTALANSYTIFLSVTNSNLWPSETSMFIMMVGPIVCSWSWLSVNKTLQTLFTGVDNVTKFRSKVADIIAPTKKDNDSPPSNDNRNS